MKMARKPRETSIKGFIDLRVDGWGDACLQVNHFSGEFDSIQPSEAKQIARWFHNYVAWAAAEKAKRRRKKK